MSIIKLLGFLCLALGVILNFSAKAIVKKYGLDLKVPCDLEAEMDEAHLKEYKFNKAVVNVKLLALLVLLPGIAMVIYLYK